MVVRSPAPRSRRSNAGRRKGLPRSFVGGASRVFAVVVWSFVVVDELPAFAQLNENCTVSVLNRTARVQPDGSWTLPNVPASFGEVRARVTCRPQGISLFGQSDFFAVPSDASVEVNTITFATPALVPTSLTVEALDGTTLTSADPSTAMTATAYFPGSTVCPDSSIDTTCDVTTAGTNYTSSNPAIAVVDPAGVVSVPTGATSGNVLITALHEGAIAVLAVQVRLTADSDGDCMPDDQELALGLDPSDWTDGLLDLDMDGLSNTDECERDTLIDNSDTDGDLLLDGEEIDYGTDPKEKDTDKDFIPDSVEIATMTDPLDIDSANWSLALADNLLVTPSTASLILLPPQVPELQLAVTGVFVNGLTEDLLRPDPDDRIPDTAFTSDDSDVCTVDSTGLVVGAQSGMCTVTAENSGHDGASEITVTSGPIAYLDGFTFLDAAYEIDVQGDYAYIAAGVDGLVVVDVSDRTSPVEMTSAAGTAGGEAKDVKVVGRYAFVAVAGVGPMGASGLDVFDLGSSGTVPNLVAHLSLPGNCLDLEVFGQRAFVVASDVGLHVVDLLDPQAPVLVSTTPVPGTTTFGVSAVDGIAVVVSDSDPVQAYDVSNAGNPILIPPTSGISANEARDVIVLRDEPGNPPTYSAVVAQNSTAGDALAIYDNIDATNGPGTPAESGGNGAALIDVARVGPIIFGADVANTAPSVRLFDASDPSSPSYLGAIDFAQLFPDPGNPLRDDDSTGIAADDRFVYVTAMSPNLPGNEAALYIGQHRAFNDSGGQAPTVTLSAPSSIRQGDTALLTANANDDVAVAFVEFLVDGQVVFRDATEPYDFGYRVPLSASDFQVEARASDFQEPSALGSSGVQQVVVLQDASPVISIDAPGGSTAPAGSAVRVQVTATDDVGVGMIGVSAPETGFLDLVPASGSPFVVERYVVAPATGSLTINAVVRDTAGNEDTASVVLTVDDSTVALNGRVVDDETDPVPFATVSAVGVDPLTALSDGTFALPNVPTAVDPLRVAAFDGAGWESRRYGSVFHTPLQDPSIGDIQIAPVSSARSDFAADPGVRGLTVGDLNLDGVPDVVVVATSPRTYSILLGKTVAGDVGLNAPTICEWPDVACPAATAELVTAAAIADMNNDGLPDLVTTGGGHNHPWGQSWHRVCAPWGWGRHPPSSPRIRSHWILECHRHWVSQRRRESRRRDRWGSRRWCAGPLRERRRHAPAARSRRALDDQPGRPASEGSRPR